MNTENLIDTFLNQDLPALIQSGHMKESEVIEAVGVLGLLSEVLHPGRKLNDLVSAAVTTCLTVALSPKRDDVAGCIGEYIVRAFRENPGLVKLNERLAAAAITGERHWQKKLAETIGSAPIEAALRSEAPAGAISPLNLRIKTLKRD